MLLQWVLAGFAGLSALAASVAVVRVGTQRSIDNATLTKMKREEREEQERRERRRKEDEERRDQARIQADERRNAVLREELSALTTRSNKRFHQWQETVADLDELWAMIEDDMLPWIREAYQKLMAAGIEIRRPPTMRRVRRQPQPIDDYDDGDDGDDDDGGQRALPPGKSAGRHAAHDQPHY